MSYRDLRNFTEMMRFLGYPRLISMENFRLPNYDLVAEILQWLVQRYDPNAALPTDTDTEQDRVILIKSIAQFMATKAHIKLNTKRLYMADGYAVKEMLKVTSLLHSAMKSTNELAPADGSGDHTVTSFDIVCRGNYVKHFNEHEMELFNRAYKLMWVRREPTQHRLTTSKLQDLKSVRQLASDVTQRGASLYHLLQREPELRYSRLTALSQPLDINKIEKGLRTSIATVEKDVTKTLNKLDNIAADEANLEAKIQKRKADLERSRKRLTTLQNVRPAFMDEFERLEDDLKVQYDEYLIKFRNMTFLEHQMEEHTRQERMRMTETENSLKRIQTRLKEEESRALLKEEFLDNDNLGIVEDGSDSEVSGEKMHERARPQNPARPLAGVRRGMYIGDESDEETLSSSDVDVGDEDDISDGELMMAGEDPEGQAVAPAPPADVDDDDDF